MRATTAMAMMRVVRATTTMSEICDVREQSERDIAVIAGSRLLSEENVKFIDTLDRNSIMIFQCHTGARSQSAAEYFRDQGFTRVYNLSGGIDAWSVEIDVEVARY